MNRKIVLLSVMILTLGSPMLSFAAGWELYDDFNSGTLDTQKWNNKSTVSTITIENQRVKIIHNAGFPNESGYLNMTQSPGSILGVRAAITIASCTGDVRTRIAGHSADIGEDHVWSSLQFQPGSNRIYSASGLEGPAPDYAWIYDTHYGEFKNPLNLLGKTYTASMFFANDGISYKVQGLGEIVYKYGSAVSPVTDPWSAIGTRSTNGDGPCTIYVDNVYVYRP